MTSRGWLHYRRAFDAAGVHPDDCRELSDIAKFPTTSKADLRENYPSCSTTSNARASTRAPTGTGPPSCPTAAR